MGKVPGEEVKSLELVQPCCALEVWLEEAWKLTFVPAWE